MLNEFFKNWSRGACRQLLESSTEIKREVLDLDKVLDKILEYGMGSLTPEELQFLNSQSN